MPFQCDCETCTRVTAYGNGESVACTQCDWLHSADTDDTSDPDLCNDCRASQYDRYDDDSDDEQRYVHDYSYKPYTRFLRSGDDEPNSKLFMGFELEVPTDDSELVAGHLFNGAGKAEDVLYCKEDGSIDGVEIVSHPMTHNYLIQSGVLGMFSDNYLTGLMRQREPSAGYGMHVHVSRAGFKSAAHTLRWLLLLYRNSDQVAALARRDSNEWSSWRDKDQCRVKAMNTERILGGDGRYFNSRPYFDRYTAVNAQNTDTLEVRVFRSTWNEQEFRAAIDLVHASVIYTRGISAYDATRGGLEFSAFRRWLQDKPQYAALVAEMDQRIPNNIPAVSADQLELLEV
jgi:hypothetical protein